MEKLKNLSIKDNSGLLSDEDYILLNETLCGLDVESISFKGLYANTSFEFVKENGQKIFRPGLGDRIDYRSLKGIDIIDFSKVGMYNAAI